MLFRHTLHGLRSEKTDLPSQDLKISGKRNKLIDIRVKGISHKKNPDELCDLDLIGTT